MISVSVKCCVRWYHMSSTMSSVTEVPWTKAPLARGSGSEGWTGNPWLSLSREGAIAGIRGNRCSSKWGWEMGQWAHPIWPHPRHRLFSPSLYLFDWTTITWQGKAMAPQEQMNNDWRKLPLHVHNAAKRLASRKAWVLAGRKAMLSSQHTGKLQLLLYTAFRVI